MLAGVADRTIPLGKRLWLAFVIVFLVVLLVQPGWLLYLQHPLQYPLALLEVLGQILFGDFCLNVGFVLLIEQVQGLGRRIDDRRPSTWSARWFAPLQYHPDMKGCVVPTVTTVLFATAVILAPGLGLPWWTAAIGWVSFLMEQVADITVIPTIRMWQYLEIEQRQDSEHVFILWQSGKHVHPASIQTDWAGAIAYLTSNEWELLQSHEVDLKEGRKKLWKRTALFRRSDDTSAYFSYWRGNVDEYVLGPY
jgi:hypothetical protein